MVYREGNRASDWVEVMHLCLTVPRGHLNLIDINRSSPIMFAEAAMLRDVPEYADLFRTYDGAVLVDNSPFKAGVHSGYGDPSLSFVDILKLSDRFTHPIVVLPDVRGNAAETYENAAQAISAMSELYHPLCMPRTCFVAQGRDWDEWWQGFMRAEEMLKPDMIGVPYILDFHSPNSLLTRETRETFKKLRDREASQAWTWALNRAELVLSIQQLGLEFHESRLLHLFGLGHPIELMFYADEAAPDVYSLDTTLPFVAAVNGLVFDAPDNAEETFYGPTIAKPIWAGSHYLSNMEVYPEATVELFHRNQSAMYRALKTGSYHSIVDAGGVL